MVFQEKLTLCQRIDRRSLSQIPHRAVSHMNLVNFGEPLELSTSYPQQCFCPDAAMRSSRSEHVSPRLCTTPGVMNRLYLLDHRLPPLQFRYPNFVPF